MFSTAPTAPPWEWPYPEDKTWISLRQELLQGSSSSVKQAVNGLKKLISSCKDSRAVQFWSDYFDLFDMLEEKQSHIIQPVLQDKIKIFRTLFDGQADPELCHWFLCILVKMMHHDNRDIVKTGFLRFISLGEHRINPNLRGLLLNFLLEQILPLLKEHAGWIFPEAEEYFNTTKKFGVFLRNVYRNEEEADEMQQLQIIALILRFLVQDGTCKSPAAAFFVVKSLGFAVNLNVKGSDGGGDVILRSNNPTPDVRNSCTLPLLEECCFLLSKTATQGLNAVDLFLRREIETILFNDVFMARIIPMLRTLEDRNPMVKNLQWSRSPMMQNILGFCGAMPLEILIDCVKINSECFSWFDKKCQHFLPSFDAPRPHDDDELNINGSRFQQLTNGVQLKGFVRMVWLSVQEKFQNAIKLTIFNALCKELLSNVDVGERFTFLSEALIEYQDLCSNKNIMKNASSIMVEDSTTTIQYCADALGKFIQELCSLSKNTVSKEIFVRKYQRLALLQVLTRSYSTSSTTTIKFENSLMLQPLFDGLCCPDNAENYIPRCNYSEFLVWKLFPVLPSIPSNNFLVSNVLNLFLKDSVLVKEEWLINDVDLRTEFYQVKFNGLASFFANYGIKKIDADDAPLDQNLVEINIWKDLLSKIITDMDKGGWSGGVKSATKCVRAMLEFLHRCNPNFLKVLCTDAQTMKILKEFIDLAWNLVFEMRKTEPFWKALEEFMSLIVHPCFDGQQILTEYSEKTFKEGETVIGLPLILVQSLSQTVAKYSDIIIMEGAKIHGETSMYQEIIQICLTSSLSGELLGKHYRVPFGLWYHLLQKQGKDNTTNNDPMMKCIFAKPPMVRLTSLSVLQMLLEKLDNPALRMSLVERIMNFYLDRNNDHNNQRYFANSAIHRKRLRIGQALLVFQPYFNEEQSAVLLDRLLGCLSDDNLQPSVRYLTEWIIVRVLVQYKSTWESFFNSCVAYWTNRIGFASRFASICLHATTIFLKYQKEESNKYFVENALLYLTQLAVGHHTTVRAYAQACFRKVYESLESSRIFPELIKKYEVVNISLCAADKFCLGSSAKIRGAVENDFYVQTFNAITHYSKEAIFIHLPRISEIANDELPTDWCLSKCGIYIKSNQNFDSIPCLPPQELEQIYLKHVKTAWHLRTTPVSGRELGELPMIEVEEDENPVAASSSSTPLVNINFQKKINPWKTLSVSESLIDTMSESVVKKRASMIEDGLIVVASLVDRAPNLGGLCRSCEIFGVSKYVIPCLNVLNDAQFQSLAVSSHTWVDIVEVPPKDLHLFLATYKSKGYRILGIEQAQESTLLNDFVFPKKSLLVLGNEKYGIPSEILPLLDECLEIPQVGVIRSLNVHVTGALCIWQYTCQHSLK